MSCMTERGGRCSRGKKKPKMWLFNLDFVIEIIVFFNSFFDIFYIKSDTFLIFFLTVIYICKLNLWYVLFMQNRESTKGYSYAFDQPDGQLFAQTRKREQRCKLHKKRMIMIWAKRDNFNRWIKPSNWICSSITWSISDSRKAIHNHKNFTHFHFPINRVHQRSWRFILE